MTGREVSRDCRRQWVVLMLAGLMWACDLTEVAIPASDPIVIVQAIIRPDRDQQWVIVERSLTGDRKIAAGASGLNFPPMISLRHNHGFRVRISAGAR